MFEQLMEEIDQEILNGLFRSATSIEAFEELFSHIPMTLTHEEFGQFDAPAITMEGNMAPGLTSMGEAPEMNGDAMMYSPGMEEDLPGISFHREAPKVGRNDPCPCGSGKKYKKCCGK